MAVWLDLALLLGALRKACRFDSKEVRLGLAISCRLACIAQLFRMAQWAKLISHAGDRKRKVWLLPLSSVRQCVAGALSPRMLEYAARSSSSPLARILNGQSRPQNWRNRYPRRWVTFQGYPGREKPLGLY